MNAQTLQSANNYTDTRIDGLTQKIQRVKRQANAGIASALAVASIPQASPGKSMIAGGVSEYNGQEGFAVGYSHHWQFDDGRGVVVKAAATANTQGDAGFAAGAGYEW
jgi:autotransporter adhesin